ncbi:hypothetical protein NDU88_004751 [Pleurodeles waltl]|uniref:Uncharacterized protein n=1 Tax=Pleurodeles waltl TaxID=8319 RepID=A0AAV7V3U1_PLEWA|nr:hypothetical protein NDU88_004751 [Pleurodeles waltl]
MTASASLAMPQACFIGRVQKLSPGYRKAENLQENNISLEEVINETLLNPSELLEMQLWLRIHRSFPEQITLQTPPWTQERSYCTPGSRSRLGFKKGATAHWGPDPDLDSRRELPHTGVQTPPWTQEGSYHTLGSRLLPGSKKGATAHRGPDPSLDSRRELPHTGVKLQDWLRPLREEKRYLLESKLKEEEQYTTMRNKVRAEKQKIESEIEQLRQLLRDKEQTLYRELEELEKKITMVENANISKLSNQITSLNALIADLEKKCKEPELDLLKVRHCLVNTRQYRSAPFILCVMR